MKTQEELLAEIAALDERLQQVQNAACISSEDCREERVLIHEAHFPIGKNDLFFAQRERAEGYHHPLENAPPARPTSLNMLVVEDEAINAMVISAMLSKLGYQVEVVDNGKLAMKKLAANSYDCIFMDIQMPEMDGVETTRIIRSDTTATYCAVPIVALTAHAMKGDREKFLAAGMNDYLSKPIEVEKLTEVLARLFSGEKER